MTWPPVIKTTFKTTMRPPLTSWRQFLNVQRCDAGGQSNTETNEETATDLGGNNSISTRGLHHRFRRMKQTMDHTVWQTA